MNAETLSALNASIAHWEKNAKARKPSRVKLGPENCALCDMFCSDRFQDCDGCPVEGRTGRVGCIGTPYGSAVVAFLPWRAAPEDKTAAKAFRAAACAEVDFLKSLRPTGDA